MTGTAAFPRRFRAPFRPHPQAYPGHRLRAGAAIRQDAAAATGGAGIFTDGIGLRVLRQLHRPAADAEQPAQKRRIADGPELAAVQAAGCITLKVDRATKLAICVGNQLSVAADDAHSVVARNSTLQVMRAVAPRKMQAGNGIVRRAHARRHAEALSSISSLEKAVPEITGPSLAADPDEVITDMLISTALQNFILQRPDAPVGLLTFSNCIRWIGLSSSSA